MVRLLVCLHVVRPSPLITTVRRQCAYETESIRIADTVRFHDCVCFFCVDRINAASSFLHARELRRDLSDTLR